MAVDSPIVIPTSLEDVVMGKLGGSNASERSAFSALEQRRMRMHEAYLFNEQQNAQAPPVEEPQGVLSKAAQVPLDILKGYGDIYATLYSNLYGGPIGAVAGGLGAVGRTAAKVVPPLIEKGFAGITSEDIPPLLDPAGKIIEDIGKTLTYQPRTGAGRVAETVLTAVPHAIKKGAEFLGDKTLEISGSPELAATVATAAEVGAYVLGDKLIRKGYTGVQRKIARMEENVFNNRITEAYENAKEILAGIKAEDIATAKANMEKQVARGPELIKSTQRIDELYNDIQSRNLKGQDLQNSLREIKTEIRRNIEKGQTTADAMQELGLRQEQIDYLEPRLRNISVGRPSITGGAQRPGAGVEIPTRPVGETITPNAPFDPITGMPVAGATPTITPQVTRAVTPPPEIRPLVPPATTPNLPQGISTRTARVPSTGIGEMALPEPSNIPPGRTTQAFILDEMAPMGADRIIPSPPQPSRAITGQVLPEIDPITGRSRASEVFLPEEVAPMGADRIIPPETLPPVEPPSPVTPNIPPSQPTRTPQQAFNEKVNSYLAQINAKFTRTTPEFTRTDIATKTAQADNMGIINKVEELAAQRMTAEQIVNTLKQSGDIPASISDIDARAIVRGVRTFLQIPSLDTLSEFNAWLSTRQTRTAPAPTPPRSRGTLRTDELVDIIFTDDIPIKTRNLAVAELKREALNASPTNLANGLRKLGLSDTEINDLLPQMKTVRATPTKRTTVEDVVSKPAEETTPVAREITLDDVSATIGKLFDAGADEAAVIGALKQYGLDDAEATSLVRQAREAYMQDKLPVNRPTEVQQVPPVTTRRRVTRKEREAESADRIIGAQVRAQEAAREAKAPAPELPVSEVVKKPRAPRREPTLYENYQKRVRELRGEPVIELQVGDILRQNFGIVLDEAQFNAMAADVARLPRDNATFNAYIKEYVQVYKANVPNPPRTNARDYISVVNLDAIDLNGPGGPLSKTAPIQLVRENGQVHSIVINERNLSASRTMAELQADAARLERSGASPDVIQTNQLLQAKLQAKADLFSITPDEAARLTSEQMQQRIYKIASDNNWEVNKLTPKGFETVPKEVVEASAKLNDGAKTEPKNVSSEDAAAYMAEQANETSTYTLEQIWENLANGIDISSELPPKMGEYYTQILNYNLEQLTTPHRRSVNAMLRSLANLFPGGESPGVSKLMSRYRGGERGSLGDIRLTARQRQAFNELKNDAIRIGRDFMELVRRDPSLNAAEKALLEEFNRSSQAPPPKPALEFANMPLDVGATLRNDPVIKRAQGDVPGTHRPSIYRSEFEGMQNANDLTKYEKRGALERIMRPDALRTPTRVFRDANIEWLHDAYHEVERSLRKEKSDTNRAISRMENQFSPEQRSAIMAELLRLEGSTDLLARSGLEHRPLNAAERTGAQFIRQIQAELFPRAQAMRVNVGKAPMDRVDQYITHMRSFNIDNAIAANTEWWRDKPQTISERMSSVRSTPFPYERTRRGGKYSVETDAFKVLRGYTDKALDQIHLGTFVAKVHELIDTPIVDPKTNRAWRMKEAKPLLHDYLKAWTNYIAGVPEQTIPPMWSGILYSASRTLGSAYMAFNPASTAIQLTSLIPTGKEVGLGTLTKASIESVIDIFTPGQPKRKFRLENSGVLDVRNMDIYFDEVGRGIVEDLARRVPRVGESASRYIGMSEALLTDWGTKLLRLFDSVAASITWDAGYAMALKAGKVGKDAFRVADHVVTRTQGSALKGDRAPIQRTQLGRAMTQFQTFAINNWEYLVSDVAGIGNKNMSNLDIAKAITYTAVTGAIVGSAIEYFTGHNPFVNPPLQFAKTALRGQKDNQSNMNYVMELVGGSTLGEALKATPITSSIRNPQGELLGPVFGYAGELGRAAMGYSGTNLPRTAIKGLVPGGLAVDKYLLAPEEKSTQSFRSMGSGVTGMQRMR